MPRVKQPANGNLLYRVGSSAWGSVVTVSSGMGGRSTKEGIYLICIHIPDSLHCTAETYTS